MKCPACKNKQLVPTKVEAGLPAMGCKACGGILLTLLYYRDWIERHPAEQQASCENMEVVQDSDSHAALHCPKCGRIMTKYRISGDVNNRLDLCATCDEAWLDDGEWKLLNALELSREIPRIFTDVWQQKIKREVSEQDRKERYRKILGEEDLLEAIRIYNWLREHPRRQDILNYISHV